MHTSTMIRLAVLLLTTMMLSGCIWAIEDDGYHRGGPHGDHGDHGDRGEHRGDRNDRHDGHR